MSRYWDGSDVYFGDDDDRAAFEVTHTSGFHIERGLDESDYFDDDEME